MEIEFIDSGVYAILNIENENFYVGSAINFRMRWRVHTNELNRQNHKNLQRAWNKYGQENFIFVIIELVNNRAILLEREQFYIDNLKPKYNILPLAGSRLGMKHSEETKFKMSLNHNRTEEARKHRSNSKLGKVHTTEHIKNFIEARKGYVHSEETKIKIGMADSKSQLGKIHSVETKYKMSIAKKGKLKSEEAKSNMRAAWILRKQNKNQVLQ